MDGLSSSNICSEFQKILSPALLLLHHSSLMGMSYSKKPLLYPYLFLLYFLLPFFFTGNWIGMCKQIVSFSSAKMSYRSSISPNVRKGIVKAQKLKMLFSYLSEAAKIKIGKLVTVYMHNSWAGKNLHRWSLTIDTECKKYFVGKATLLVSVLLSRVRNLSFEITWILCFKLRAMGVNALKHNSIPRNNCKISTFSLFIFLRHVFRDISSSISDNGRFILMFYSFYHCRGCTSKIAIHH